MENSNINNPYEQLALALYRVTERMPQEEPLRFRIRDACLRIVEESNNRDNEKLFFALDALLSVAEKQDWGIHSHNFSVLRIEFSRLSAALPSEISLKEEGQKEEGQTPLRLGKLSSRQKKILAFLRDNKTIQIRHIQHLFPGLSPRTLRRDLEGMVQKNSISKNGKTNGTSYTIIRTISEE